MTRIRDRKKKCKNCKWYYRYRNWRYNNYQAWHKGRYIYTCRDGNQNGDCENYAFSLMQSLKHIADRFKRIRRKNWNE